MGLNCLICHSNSKYLYKWTPPYSLHYCPSCKALFSDPIPSDEELCEFYQGFLYRKPDPSRLKTLIQRKKKDLQKLFGDSIRPGRSLLDYGGGTGIASLAAVELGLKVTLYEIDNDALDFVRSFDKGDSVRTCGNLSELEDQSFDLIFADNVIEHVREPKALMSSLYARLNQNGQLIFKTPNARNTELLFHPMVSVNHYLRRVNKFNHFTSAISAAFFRPWTLDPPRHLYSFSAESLMLLAQQIGVDKAEIGYYRIPLWEYALAKKLLRIPNSVGRTAKWLVLAVLSLFECGTKLIELLLRVTNVTSAGGLIIRIKHD